MLINLNGVVQPLEIHLNNRDNAVNKIILDKS